MGILVRYRTAYFALPFLAALGLGGCSAPLVQVPVENAVDPVVRLTGVVSGNISYREKVALSPDAVVRVTLEDATQAIDTLNVIAKVDIHPERQIPLPFALAYDPARLDPTHRYAVRAQIMDAQGKTIWHTTEHYGVVTLGNPDHADILLQQVATPETKLVPPVAAGVSPVQAGRTFAFTCEENAFTVRMGHEEVALYLDNRYEILPKVPAASGTKYQKRTLIFWSKEDEARLQNGSHHFSACHVDAARSTQEDMKLSAVTFHADNSRSGWQMVIEQSQWIKFTGDEGKSTAYLPMPAPVIKGARTTYSRQTKQHNLHVTIDKADCRDALSNRKFPAKVTVRLNGKEYQGCGHPL